MMINGNICLVVLVVMLRERLPFSHAPWHIVNIKSAQGVNTAILLLYTARKRMIGEIQT
jgi:hypothetical protein